jgi:hypothetical protein
MRKLALLLLLSSLAIALAASGAAQARSLHLGINANTAAWGDPGEEQDNVLETGALRLREDIGWEEVEPADDEWEWADFDQLYSDAAERGMTILPVLYGSPCWAVPKETDPNDCWNTYPNSNAEYAEYVAAVAARYGPDGNFWDENPGLDGDLASTHFEIWNEPYLCQFTNNEVDPAKYANLYKAAVTAGRGANPASRYLIESTVDATLEFEPDCVAKENSPYSRWAEDMVEAVPTLDSYVDGIAIHPYPGSHDPDYEPENGTDFAFRNTDIERERWLELSVNKPLWITEVGYSSCDDGADDCVPGETQAGREEQKAEWLAELFDKLGEDAYAYVHAAYLYNLRVWEDPNSPNDNFSTWLGILDAEWEPLPAWDSFADAVQAYDGVPVANTTITGQEITPEGGSQKAKFTFTVNDGTASLDCQLDAGEWTPCTSPKTYTGLSASGSHTFRVRATNAEATEAFPATYSWSAAPKATTGSVSAVGASGATLNGTVNPEGGSTTYQFEYGTTTAYGKVAPASPKSIGSGTSDTPVNETIGSLEAGTTYHYRVVGTNAGGTTKGADRMFTTEVPVTSVSVLDELVRDELPLATSDWSKASWAGEIGGVWNSGGYLGFGSNSASAVTTAYWDTSTFSDSGNGDLVASKVGCGANWENEYLSLWLNMPNPASARSGYEARFAEGGGTNYTVQLAKWVAGTRTVLASTTGVTLTPKSTVIALSQVSGNVTIWTGTTSFAPLLSAADSTYTSGYAGLEVIGVGPCQYMFRAGALP